MIGRRRDGYNAGAPEAFCLRRSAFFRATELYEGRDRACFYQASCFTVLFSSTVKL